MGISRRELITGTILGLGTGVAPRTIAAIGRNAAPGNFLWGTAISAHQSEGSNCNSDSWLLENIQPTVFKERSGDACDSYHRYAEDIELAARLGFNSYRFGIEWSRIEPSQGFFSNAELDHYESVLQCCRTYGLKPVVTFSHFTVPLWFAIRGGFEAADSPDLFAGFCSVSAARLGKYMHLATTFNEANIQLLLQIMPQYSAILAAAKPMIAAAARATGSPRFSKMAYADPEITTPLLLEAHRRGYAAIKAACPSLPVGLTLTTQDIQPVGTESQADQVRDRLYGDWLTVARDHADFLGVQPYTRLLVGASGIVAPAADAELTDAGYEFYPAAVANTIRWAHRTTDKPIFVTESGIATDNDTRRVAFIDQALTGVRQCLDEGIPVHGYMYWSLLDNYEWASGYGKHFGLVAVDRDTFKRTPKPSAWHLGAVARANKL